MAEKQKMRVADYLLKRIADLGITEIFYLPGGGAMYLDDAMKCESRIEPILCHHEQACGISAEAYGRTHSQGFGVAIVTTGPGATNVVTPLAGAWIESLPMLIISGQVKRQDSINSRPIRQGGAQEVDIISIVNSITKYAVTVEDPKLIKKHFDDALFHMKSGRPGPVWLDIPLDVQAAPIDEFELENSNLNEFIESDEVHISLVIETIKKMLEESERPLILAGHGVRISGAAEKFKTLVEQLSIPCVFTWNAMDLLEFDHPLYVGRPGVVATRAPNFAVQNCDCLISIGSRLDNVTTAYNPKGFARGAKKVIVDIDHNELDRQILSVDLKVEMDAKRFIESWLSWGVEKTNRIDWVEKCNSWKYRYPFHEKTMVKSEERMSHYDFVDAVSEVIPENHLVITGSSGLAVEIFYTGFKNKHGQRVFLTSGLGSMGYGLSAAVGACIGAGKKKTICVESDGSLMLNIQELATIKALNLPIKILIMNNDGYASIRNTQKNYFNERYVGTSLESGLYIPDLVKISESFGIPALEIHDVNDLQKINEVDGPYLFNVFLKRNEILEPKALALPQADGSILSMPLEDMSPLLPREVLRQEMMIPLDPISEKVQM